MNPGMYYAEQQSTVLRAEDSSHKDPARVCACQRYLPFDIPWRPEKILHATQRISRAECVVSGLDGGRIQVEKRLRLGIQRTK